MNQLLTHQSFQRPPKISLPSSSGCHWIGQGIHPTSIGSESEEAVGPSFPKGPVIFPVLNDTCTAGPENEAKTKTRQRPVQRRIAKGNERPPDHQAGRRSRKETYPPVAQNGNGPRVREFLARQRPKKTVKWMRTAKKEQSKTSSSYEKKPARKTKNAKKQTQLKQVSTRNPYRRETGERGQRGLHSKVSQTTGRRTGRFSKARWRKTR